MPRYNPNTANANATFPVFPKDSYEFKILSFKPKKKQKEVDGKQEEKISISVTLECISSGKMAGKKAYPQFGLDENTKGFFKRFMMAAYDYPINTEGEERFNEEILLEKDESFDIETGDLGSYYKDAVGCTVIGDASETTYLGNPQNQWSWRGLSSSIPTEEEVSV